MTAERAQAQQRCAAKMATLLEFVMHILEAARRPRAAKSISCKLHAFSDAIKTRPQSKIV